MTRTLEPPGAPAAPPVRAAVPNSRAHRAVERRLLAWMLPLALLGAWGVAQAQRHPNEAFGPAATALGTVWLACAALHVLLSIVRFDGDPVLLPVLCGLFLIGGTYHLDLRGPATAGLTPQPYLGGVLASLALLAGVTAGGRWFKRLSVLAEEKIWWRVAGDRPYYASIPFHFLLIGLMGVLGFLLMVRGIHTEGDALIQVPLPGGYRFTPSELIRLAVAFFLADYLGRNSRILRNLRQPLGRVWPLNHIYFERRTELTVVLTTVGLYCLFFYAFRDFGPAAVIIVLTLTALYAATGRILTPLLLGLGMALVIAIPTWKHLAFHTLARRFEMWRDPWNTHFVNGDHLARILWSIASGGWTGMGVGTQNIPRNLPLAQNDTSFAGIAATMGLWGALATLGLFAALTWRGMLAARQAPTDRTRLLAFCLTSLLAFQAIWICGAMVRVFPFTGINLPFVSTGLTSLLASTLALGTVWNISRARGAGTDETEASPEVLRSVTRLARPITFAFLLPAVGVVIYGCPWINGDRTFARQAMAVGRDRQPFAFSNPYLEQFRQQFSRGRIFSADGKLLAVTDPDPNEMEAIRENSPSFADYVARDQRNANPGQRYYPLRESAALLVGWAPQGKFSAQEGSVEASWDGLLRGYRPEQLPFYFRTRNNPLVRPPQPQDLQLTVDSELQRYATRRLADAVKGAGGAGGALVVFDASSGDVLAAATAPTFDPNDLSLERMQKYVAQHASTQVLSNKALARNALFFPGSTFKVLTAAAALDEGVTGSVTCRNGRNAEPVTWEYQGRRYRRDTGKISDYAHGGHGTMSLEYDLDRALSVSCNVFFGKLAATLGAERLRRAMVNAELKAVPTEAELAEHLPYSGFGQIDVKTSPLEMAMLAAAAGVAEEEMPEVAATRPHWVEAVVSKNNKREPEGIFGAPDRRPYKPFPNKVAQRLHELMAGVVESYSGTAHAAFFQGGAPRLPGIRVGGKTGTAEFEKTVTDRRGKRVKALGRHAWFIGFARSEHEVQPRTLAFAVLVEDVRRGGTGGTVCAPVARDVIAKVLPVAGQSVTPAWGGLERYYQRSIRPKLGPLGPVVDWLRNRFGR